VKLTKFLKFLEWGTYAVCVFIISFVLTSLLIPKILDVSEISKHPEVFKGNIGIRGEIYKIVKKKGEPEGFLIYDCEKDRGCGTIPVFYKGEIPKVKSRIIVHGKVKLEDGYRFIKKFDAYKISMIDDDFSGNMFYSIGKAIRAVKSLRTKEGIIEFRKWLYLKCNKCSKFKKMIIPTPLFPSA